MGARPSIQFYPADWRGNAKLRLLSSAARGYWIDILCVLHDSDEYGVVRWSLAELARVAGVPLKAAQQLAAKGVLKGSDNGCEPYIFTPYHAGQYGDPVILIAKNSEKIWFSSRMVRDEWIRSQRGKNSRFTSENQPPTRSPTETPTRAVGERQGDGLSSSSASSSKNKIRDSSDSPVGPRAKKTGTRWDADAAVPEAWIEEGAGTRAKHRLPMIDLRVEAVSFANYWSSKPGKDATKLDWRKTWINWTLKAEGAKHGNGHVKPATANDKFLAGADALLRKFDAQGRSGEGQNPDNAVGQAGRPLLPR